MKRKTFRLASVLRYYAVRKQRAEFDLQQGSRVLQEIEAEIDNLQAEIVAVAALLHGESASRLTTGGWIACYRKSEHLGKCLVLAHDRRQRQAEIVAKLKEQRKRWAIAEETLLSLRKNVAAENAAEAASAEQVQLDETVLRRWLDIDLQPDHS